MGGETIILAVDDSSLYVLNETASLLWSAADGRTPLEAIVDRVLCPAFDVDRDTGLRDALELVEALASHGILVVSDRPIDTPGQDGGTPRA